MRWPWQAECTMEHYCMSAQLESIWGSHARDTPVRCCLQCFESQLRLLGRIFAGFSRGHIVEQSSAQGQVLDADTPWASWRQPSPLNSSGSMAYTIRMNHTYLPSNRQLLNTFDILPDAAYKQYWLFVNLQLSLDRHALLALTICHHTCQHACMLSLPESYAGRHPLASGVLLMLVLSYLGMPRQSSHVCLVTSHCLVVALSVSYVPGMPHIRALTSSHASRLGTTCMASIPPERSI